MKIAKQRNNNNNKNIIAIAVAAIAVVLAIVLIVVLVPSKDKKGDTPSTTTTTKAEAKVTGIVLESAPSKTSYYVGEEFDPSGIKIKVVTTKTSTNYYIDASDPELTFDGFDSSISNAGVTVYARYRTYAITFDVIVEEPPVVVEGTVVALEVNSSYKSVFDLGEELDPKGLGVTIHVEENDTPYYVDASYPGIVVSGFDSSVVNGELTITVSYGDVSDTFVVSVVDKANTETIILSLNIVTKPQITYYVGEEFDFSNIKVQVVTNQLWSNYFIYSDNEELSFSGFDSSAPEEDQVITVTYKGVSTTFTVDIIEKVEKPTVVSFEVLNLRNSYTMERWNKNGLSISGAKLLLTYSDGTTEEIPVKWDYISPLPNEVEPGTITITITYSGIVVEVPITITE